jgi:hypothetical protein
MFVVCAYPWKKYVLLSHIHGNCLLISLTWRARSLPSRSPRIRISIKLVSASRCVAMDYSSFRASWQVLALSVLIAGSGSTGYVCRGRGEKRAIAAMVTHFLLWLYSPLLGLRLHRETLRFISVNRCRTVSRTASTGDQLCYPPRVIVMMQKFVE